MSVVTYDAGQMLLTVDDTGVERALGTLARKTPAVLKVAINRTAREARRDLISKAEERYALTVRGKERLRLLKVRKSATNTSLQAVIRQSDEGQQENAAYFQHSPTIPRMGQAAFSSPEYQRVRVLRDGPLQPLEAGVDKDFGPVSKGFLISVHNDSGNDHLMYAHRVLGSSTENVTTKTGKRRWKNSAGQVEKAYDVNRIGASSQERAVWFREVLPTAAENLERFIQQRIRELIEAER